LIGYLGTIDPCAGAWIESDMREWRTGTNVKLNVYEGDRPVCQCHSQVDAERIIRAMNSGPELLEALKLARRCIATLWPALKGLDAWCRSSLATTETIIDTAIAKAEGIEIAE
jgi:hypothetical protein